MRILFSSWPGYGHLLPMVALIRAAQRADHEVVVSSGADMSAVIDQLGVRGHQSGVTMAQSYARLPGAAVISQLTPQEQAGFAAKHLFGAGAVDRAADVADLVSTWRPDLIVHDTFELGAPAVAVAQGIRHVTHGYGPMSAENDFMVSEIGSAMAAAGSPNPAPAVFASPYLDICPPSMSAVAQTPWQAARGLRPSAGEVPDGALLPPEMAHLPHADSVYVTLGTVMNQAPDVFRTVITGADRLPVNLIVTTGPGFDSTSLGPLPDAVVITDYLPQALVLPKCTAVVSHAGAGTMLGALCFGLPQLCLPQSTDQPLNAAALEPTGAALVLSGDEVTAESVETALGRLLGEPSFRASASRLRDEIAAMPSPDATLAALTS